MTIYKYHIRLLELYKEFQFTPFFTGEVEKILSSLNLSTLRTKKFIKWIKRNEAEKLRPEIKEWPNYNWSFWVFTQEGKDLVKFLDKRQDLIAKKLLKESI